MRFFAKLRSRADAGYKQRLMNGRRRARELRRDTTLPERLLWSLLRRRQINGHHFRRQHPIGPYVVDFVCIAAMLVIEIDGESHRYREQYDDERTHYLERCGYRVVRYPNADVLRDADAVAKDVRKMLADRDD
jgi:very-short-patch-repair endonuclease